MCWFFCTDDICRCNYCKTPFIKVTGLFKILMIITGFLLLIFPTEQSEIDQMIKFCDNSTLSDIEKNFRSYVIGYSILIFLMCLINFILWIYLCISRNNQVNYHKYKDTCLIFMIINLIVLIIGFYILCYEPFSDCYNDSDLEEETNNDEATEEDFFNSKYIYIYFSLAIFCFISLCFDSRNYQIKLINIDNILNNNNDNNNNDRTPTPLITNNANQYNTNVNPTEAQTLALNNQIEQMKRKRLDFLTIKNKKLEEKRILENNINITEIEQLKNEIKMKENMKKQLEYQKNDLQNEKNRTEQIKNNINKIKNDKIEIEREINEIKNEDNEIKHKILKYSSLFTEVTKLNKELEKLRGKK